MCKRKFVLIIVLLCFVFCANAQDKNYFINQIILLNKSKETAQSVTKYYISQTKVKKPHVPEAVWNKINNEVDYSLFLNKLYSVFNNNFTLLELKKIHGYLKSGDTKNYNLSVKKFDSQLYNEGISFSKNLPSIISSKLFQYGY